MKHILLCLLISIICQSTVYSQTPASTLGSNCVLVPGWSNAIFEYNQNATHLVASLRVSGLGPASWLGLGFDTTAGTAMTSGTVYLGGFNQNQQVVTREGLLTSYSLPAAIGPFADSTSMEHVDGVSTLIVVRPLAAPGSVNNYYSVPSSGDTQIILAYKSLATFGTNSFPRHDAAKRFTVSLTQTQNTCSAPMPQPSNSMMMPMSSSTPPTPTPSMPMPPPASGDSCVTVPNNSNTVVMYKSNGTHLLASLFVSQLLPGSWMALGFDEVNRTGMSSGTVYIGSVDATGNATYREGLLNGASLPANIGIFANQISMVSLGGITALVVVRPLMAPENAPAGYVSLNTTLNSVLVAYRNQSTFTNNISSHTFAKRFTVSLTQVQNTCPTTPPTSSPTPAKPVSSSNKLEIVVVLLILIFNLLF